MSQALGLGSVLFAMWVILSGHTEPLLLGLGLASTLLVLWISHRMGLIRRGTTILPLRFGPSLAYLPWLIVEIVKSNIDVARRILSPGMPISPTLTRVDAPFRHDMTRVVYANSITLTPGTVSVDVTKDYIEVHALSREAAESLAGGEMRDRVGGLEQKD